MMKRLLGYAVILVACGSDPVRHLDGGGAEITSMPPTTTITVVGSTQSDFTAIELTPSDVGSTSSDVFATLPTENPALYGLTGSDVRKVNFDTTPGGDAIASDTTLTTEYASLGVTMENITVASSVFGGAASAPNATTTPAQQGFVQQFHFSVNVVALGVVNTSPDQDTFEFYDANNQLIFSTRDQDSASSPDFNIDRFVGARTNNDRLIATMKLVNASGNMELDELVFEVSDATLAHTDFEYQVIVTGLDSATLVYSLPVAPTGAMIDANGTIRWRATSADAGDHAFTVRVVDGQGGAAEQSFTVTVTVT